MNIKEIDFIEDLTKVKIHEIKPPLTIVGQVKGQLISKCLFGIYNSSKKQTKQFDLTTMIPQVKLFSFIFWKI